MKFKSHFRFNKQERSGILFLLLIIVVFQGVRYYIGTVPYQKEPLVMLNQSEQARLDSLQNTLVGNQFKMYPFNPNYISDAKGYSLGMSTEQLDRLFAFRNKGKFINSAEEFQAVTQISDSLLAVLSSYFKFPDWVEKNSDRKIKKSTPIESKRFPIGDLNTATADELMGINGIGETLSNRIIKFRDKLGGFLVDEQLQDVYGLKPEVVELTLQRFHVVEKPNIEKVNINTASVDELAKLLYINYELAKQIVNYRAMNGTFTSLDDLSNVTSFPVDRIGRIKLYLTL